VSTINRLFAADVPVQVIQNLVTALDPQLLTEHCLMLLIHDLSRLLPLEELPHRMLAVMAEYFNGEEDETEEQSPPN
jgi:hypothetical protein